MSHSRITESGEKRAFVRLTVTMDPVHHVYPLEERAKQQDRSVSWLVRKAVEEYLERHPMEHCT